MKFKNIFILLLCSLILLTVGSATASELNNQTNYINSVDNSYSTHNMDIDKNIKSNSEESKTIGLNSSSFDTYVTNGKFNDLVSDGDTIDVNGKLDSARFALTVDKSLNFISSNNQSYIDVYTQSTGFYGEASGGQITFSSGASGSNITNLYFYNTRVVFSNTSDILVNNISVIDYEKNIGSGTGHFILNNGSNNITINNSYFYTKDNGAHSTVVFTGANNCIFENNTIVGEGSLGNLVYINAYNSVSDDANDGIIIRNNLINASSTGSQLTCFAICIQGANHVIENNTVLYNGYCLSGIWGTANYENITIKDNYFQSSVLLGNTTGVQINSMKNVTIENNTMGGLLIDNAYIYNNKIGSTSISGNNSIFEGNTGKSLTIIGNNTLVNNNTLNNMGSYTINNTGINNSITNNVLVCINTSADESIINSTETVLANNSEEPRHIYITKNNSLDWGYYNNIHYKLNNTLIHEGDWINIDSAIIEDVISSSGMDLGFEQEYLVGNLTFFNMTIKKPFNFEIVNSTLINCYLPGANLKYNKNWNAGNKLINSTIYYAVTLNYYNTIDLDENSHLLLSFDNNTYTFYFSNMRIVNSTTHMFSSISGKVGKFNYCAVNDTSTINVFGGSFTGDIFVNRIVYWEGILEESKILSNMTFISGSMGSSANNIIFDNYVILNESGITFTNCTFNKGVILNNVSDIIIKDCIFNTTDTPIVMIGSSENTIENNTFIDLVEHESNCTINMVESSDNIIKNNIINTTNQYTIVGDENSVTNDIKDNILYAAAGNDKVSINLNDNNNFVESKAVRYNSNINFELNNETNIHITDKVPITVTVTDDDNNPIENGEVEVYADGIFQTCEKLTNGTFTTNVTFDRVNSNATLKLWYYADDTYYNNVANISEINVEKSPVVIISSEISGYVGDNITLEANITTEAGTAVNEGNVYFIFGTEKYSAQVINGTATYTTEILPEWMDLNKVTIQYFNSTLFIGNNIKVIPNITVPPIATKISMDEIINTFYNPTTIMAVVTDENDTNMTTGSVVFTDADGNIIAQSDVNEGIAQATITFNEEIDTTLTATYYPTEIGYSTNFTTAKFNIQKPVTNIVIDEVDPVAGNTITLTARVTDQLANNLTGGKIVFKVNGKTVKDANGKVVYVKVIDGIAQVNYTVDASMANKNITVQAVYSGCTKYDKQTVNMTLTVSEQKPTITIEQLPDSIQANSNITIKATVKIGDNPITTGKVVFKLNGKVLKDANGKVIYAKVDENGQATIESYNIGDLKVNEYTLKTVFISSVYDNVETNQTINIVKV